MPNKGTIQVTLFNPNNTVVKMFVVMYDLSDMPPGHRTFLRQRTMYVPLDKSTGGHFGGGAGCHGNANGSPRPVNKVTNGCQRKANSKEWEEAEELKSYLRYLIHLR